TNEGGVGGKIRFLQNITGLWILQRLIAQWKERGERCGYDFLLSAAESADIPSVIDVDDKIFQNPVDMEDAIAEYCEAHGHPIPETYGEVVRCVLQSLALRYKQGIDQLNRLLPAPVEQLNIIGGGCRNSLLNRLTAEALGIPVYAGPVEATAIGNILVQAIAKGEIGSREEIKEFI
ncbi:MAG: rhamnulokinase, partial [Bacteroides cellulosilyticus]|nr:rhamnulokinase [Bacteroides cellulosilyticus]